MKFQVIVWIGNQRFCSKIQEAPREIFEQLKIGLEKPHELGKLVMPGPDGQTISFGEAALNSAVVVVVPIDEAVS